MATTEVKAKLFLKHMEQAEAEARQKHGISRDDVDVIVRVKVETTLKYNNHEDED